MKIIDCILHITHFGDYTVYPASISGTNNTDSHDITVILLKVALNTITHLFS